jgi:hypothetical protein
VEHIIHIKPLHKEKILVLQDIQVVQEVLQKEVVVKKSLETAAQQEQDLMIQVVNA